jgi:tRNA(Met) C34 N-acetyltransferase TmcA
LLQTVVVTAVAGIGIIMTIVDHMAEMAVVTATTATVVDSMVETVMAEAEVLREKEDVTTTGVPALQKTGQNLFPETKESKQSSSVPEDTNLRELILIAMRIYQWRPPEVMFRLLLKIFVT